ncbi:RHO1 GDP-GTP exchange protein 2 [Tulasnella sp. 408]|nr:RHO1 GDP-GTP exchange protein 2 [Tulasnella sp. 408]
MEIPSTCQPDQSFTFPDTPEELGGILEIPDRPEITGGYADVYHGFWTNSQGEQVEVAIKILKALNPRSRQGDQDSLVKKAETVYQAGCGLQHLHSCSPPICHADIKPRNVLINNLGQAALVDFGLSRAMLDLDVTSGFTTSETVKGTLVYMAVELSSGQKASCASDVYAFGGLVLTLREDIGLKQPNPQSSSDPATPIGAGGSDYSETDFETSAKHLQAAPDTSNTSKETHDPVLEVVLKAQSFSASSKTDVPLPSSAPSPIANSDQPTRTGDRRDKGTGLPRPSTEQQVRLNTKPQPKAGRRSTDESLEDTPIRDMAALWIHSAPPEIVASVSDQEKRRQEAIHELICTERDFVRDMEYLRDFWAKPLRTTNIIPKRRRAEFVDHVFQDLDEIIAVNTRLRNAFNMRQKYVIVEKIGDIFLNLVKYFEPFVRYGGHQPYGRYEVEQEKRSNQAFVQFVQETERLPESRKLELNAYLKKPTARLARYPLLLETIRKYTSDRHPDKVLLVELIKTIRALLKRAREQNGKIERWLILLQLDQQLVFGDVERVDLGLRDMSRELLYKGILRRRGGQGDNCDLQVFLFDHALLMVKANTKHGQLRVYKRPIPLELLVVETQGEYTHRSSLSRELESDSRGEYPITFTYLGRNGYSLKLWESTVAGRTKWLEEISKQQEAVRKSDTIFNTVSLGVDSYRWEKFKCAAPFGQSVMTIPLGALDAPKPGVRLKGIKTVATDISFFKVGTCLGRTLLCLVNASAPASTIKILEPNKHAIRGKKGVQGWSPEPSAFANLAHRLRAVEEFDIPIEATSIHFLRGQLCVGCAEGFQIVDLNTLAMVPLLDPADPLLDFVQKGLRDSTPPIAIYRINNDFLLCYAECAFYVDKNGRRARPDWIVHWEGYPSSFALEYPFVLAFEPTFIEIHNIESGQLVQIIPGKDVRCLFADTPPSVTHSAATRKIPLMELRENFYVRVTQERHSGAAADPYARDEIILVSDGKVMAVELATLRA